MTPDDDGSWMEIDGVRIPIAVFSLEFQDTGCAPTGQSRGLVPEHLSCEIPLRSLEISRPILPGVLVPLWRVDYRDDGTSETTVYPTRRN